MMGVNDNVMDLFRRSIKYLFEGLVVAFVASIMPKKSLSLDEVATLGVIAALVFAILDTFVPNMAVSARSGAGFGLGANLVGFPAM